MCLLGASVAPATCKPEARRPYQPWFQTPIPLYIILGKIHPKSSVLKWVYPCAYILLKQCGTSLYICMTSKRLIHVTALLVLLIWVLGVSRLRCKAINATQHEVGNHIAWILPMQAMHSSRKFKHKEMAKIWECLLLVWSTFQTLCMMPLRMELRVSFSLAISWILKLN